MQNGLQTLYYKDFTFIPNILKEIYLDRVYQPFLDRKDLIIVDIGANIGLTARYFKDFGRVIAVEPSVQHLEVLRENLKDTNVEIYPYAISTQTGKTKLNHNMNTTMFSLDNAVGNGESEEVDTITLEDLMNLAKIDKIDLLKLDCEGIESELIVSSGFARALGRVKTIVGEWHPWTAMSKDLFKDMLTILGYTFAWYPNTEAAVFKAVRI